MCLQLAWAAKEKYETAMPQSQYGAVNGRGTDFATHLVRSFLDYCSIASLSVFILFVDLVKAYDRIVREIVLGWSDDACDPWSYLLQLGLAEEQAAWLIDYLAKYGHLFQQWGVDDKVTAMIRALYSHSWFSYGTLDTAVTVRLGGRQGCNFGATIFNSCYSVALVMLMEVLVNAGVTMRLKQCDEDF